MADHAFRTCASGTVRPQCSGPSGLLVWQANPRRPRRSRLLNRGTAKRRIPIDARLRSSRCQTTGRPRLSTPREVETLIASVSRADTLQDASIHRDAFVFEPRRGCARPRRAEHRRPAASNVPASVRLLMLLDLGNRLLQRLADSSVQRRRRRASVNLRQQPAMVKFTVPPTLILRSFAMVTVSNGGPRRFREPSTPVGH